MLRTLATLAALAGLLAALGGCNTIAGFGQDLKAGGRAIEKAASSSKPK